MKKLFIVILYKTDISKSATINSFVKCNLFKKRDNHFYIWDNSPTRQTEKEITYLKKLSPNITYSFHSENTPLAIAYNTIISNFLEVDYIAIFDQDTTLLDLDYQNIVDSAIVNNPDIDLFIPKIYTKGGVLFSPGKIIFPGKARKLSDVKTGVINTKNIIGVTSGLIVSRRFIVSENFLFNERLRLYGVDTDFFIRFSKRKKKLYVLPIRVNHSFAFEDDTLSIEEKRRREVECTNCLFVIYQHFYERIFCYALKIYYSLRYYLRCKIGKW